MQHHEIFKDKIDGRPLFEILKQGTTDLHRKMDAMLPVLRNDFTLDRYRQFLLRLLGFYIPVEENIEDFLARERDPFDMSVRSKVPLLISDLKALGVSDEEIHDVPICGAMKEINTMADLVGILYVLEGSTLGGQLIQQKLKDHLSLAPNQLRYYSSYGKETYEMWYKFRAKAEAMIEPEEKEEVLSRARSTFIKMKNWLKMNEIQA